MITQNRTKTQSARHALLSLVVAAQSVVLPGVASSSSSISAIATPKVAVEDHFGRSVAISGDVAVVGAPFEEGNLTGTRPDAGAVYIYRRNGNSWSLQQRIAGPASNAHFGLDVDVEANRVVVGAPNIDSVFVYRLSATQSSWQLDQAITQTAEAFQTFGAAVAIHGDDLIVGAPAGDGPAGTNSGAVEFYREVLGEFIRIDKTLGSVAGARLGASVDVDSESGFAVLGAPGQGDGRVVLYRDNSSGSFPWVEADTAGPPVGGLPNNGTSVALVNRRVVVGHPGATGGRAYEYSIDSSNDLTFEVSIFAGSARPSLGHSVALVRDTRFPGQPSALLAFLGSPLMDLSGAADVGEVYVYANDPIAGSWELLDTLHHGGLAGDQFGYDVAADADSVLIGAALNDVDFADQGSAHFFQRVTGDYALRNDVVGNAPPEVTVPASLTTTEDNPAGAPLVLRDDKPISSSITVTATSSVPSLVERMSVVGTGANRTLVITPSKDANGSATITVIVSEGVLSSGGQFPLTVTPVNDQPVLDLVDVVTFPRGQVGFQNVDIVDSAIVGPPNEVQTFVLEFEAVPPNPVVESITWLAGQNLARIGLTGAAGQVTLTARMRDSGGGTNALSDPKTFVVKVLEPPSIAAIAPIVMNEGDSALRIPFTINAPDSDPANLVVLRNSLNPSTIPDSRLLLENVGPLQWNLMVDPEVDAFGLATLRLIVFDNLSGLDSSSTDVSLTINPVNDRPVLSLGSISPWSRGTNGLKEHSFFASVDLGPPNEDASQQVAGFGVDVRGAANIVRNVTLNDTGKLEYVLTGESGLASIDVVAQDDGGIANGGQDTSEIQTFILAVEGGVEVDLLVAISDRTATPPPPATPDQVRTYVVEVVNLTDIAAPGALVSIRGSDGLEIVDWDCAGPAGSCVVPGGVGDLDDVPVNLPAAQGAIPGAMIFSITALVTQDSGNAMLTATVIPGGVQSDPNIDNNQDQESQAIQPGNEEPILRDGFEDR